MAAEVDLGFLGHGRVYRHDIGPRASYGRSAHMTHAGPPAPRQFQGVMVSSTFEDFKQHREGVHSRGAGNWRQLMAGSGGSQGLPVMALAMASSAVMPWAVAESR
jgi:hypothetical protein